MLAVRVIVFFARSALDGVKQGHVHDVIERVGAVVVIADGEWPGRGAVVLAVVVIADGENAVLEDDCLGFICIPLGPRDPKTLLIVRVEVVGESDDIVPELPAVGKGGDEV